MKHLKLLCLVLCVALVFSACASGTDSVVTTTTKDGTSASSNQTTTTTEKGPKYDITYTSAVTYADSIGSVWVQVIAEITNTGSVPLYLGSAGYDLEDDTGKLVSTGTYVSCYPDVINPGEKGYMYDEDSLDNVSSGLTLKVVPRIEIEAATVDCVRLQTSEVSLSSDKFYGVKFMGRVENTTAKEQKNIYVVAVMYDVAGAPIGIAFTIITETLQAGAKMGFECHGFSLPDSVTIDKVANYIIYAYPQQFQF